jgi:hypothetical protein
MVAIAPPGVVLPDDDAEALRRVVVGPHDGGTAIGYLLGCQSHFISP